MLDDTKFGVRFWKLQLDARGLMLEMPQFNVGSRHDPEVLGGWRYPGEKEAKLPTGLEAQSATRRETFLSEVVLTVGVTTALAGLLGAAMGLLSGM